MLAFSRRTLIALTFFVGRLAYAEGAVEWSDITASGNGCPSGSAVITATPDGNELAWTADSFGYDLQGESSASRFCRLSATAAIKPGYYLEEIRQQMTYGGSKTITGSEFSVGMQARFLGANLQPITRTYADGKAFDWKRVTVRRTQKVAADLPAEYFCGQEARSGLFQGTLASNGMVSTPEGKVAMGVQGLTVAYKARFKWLPCPQ